jgi:hypothetical protein
MPRAMYAHLLRAVYDEATRLIEQRKIPTEMIFKSATLFRGFDQKHTSINTQGVFPKQNANAALLIRDQNTDTNRFTGQSLNAGIPAWGGLYCSLQAQAMVNELSHYARANSRIPRSGQTGFPSVDATLRGTCIVRIRLMSPVLAADISAHNPGSGTFLDALGRSPTVQAALRASGRSGLSLAGEISDSEDCSAARGIGLAVANTPWLKALKATTVRRSSRSPEEMGDNLILFGANGERVAGLWIDEAYLFPLRGAPVVCPVEFAANT